MHLLALYRLVERDATRLFAIQRKERFICLAGCDIASCEGERVCTRGELTSIDFYGN